MGDPFVMVETGSARQLRQGEAAEPCLGGHAAVCKQNGKLRTNRCAIGSSRLTHLHNKRATRMGDPFVMVETGRLELSTSRM